MSCSTMCGCNPVFGILHKKDSNFVIKCYVNTFTFTRNNNSTSVQEFIAPKTGYYIAIAVATGGDVKEVFKHGYGVEHKVVYLSANQKVKYALGSDTIMRFPDDSFIKALRNPNKLNEPMAVFQYIGNIKGKAKSIPNAETGVYQKPAALSPYAGYELHAIIPQPTDINYLNTGDVKFMYWGKTKAFFPYTGNYTVGGLGDDYVSVYIDGDPVLIWSPYPDRDMREIKVGERSGGVNVVHVKQGWHDILIWNLSDIPSRIHSAMFINDNNKQKIVASTPDVNWEYVRSPVDCFDGINPTTLQLEPNKPYPLVDEITWVEKNYNIPCATVKYQQKHINGVPVEEYRETKVITSREDSKVITETSGSQTKYITVVEKVWLADNNEVCRQEISRNVTRTETHSGSLDDDMGGNGAHDNNDPEGADDAGMW